MKSEISNSTTTQPSTLAEATSASVGGSGRDKPKSKRDHGSPVPGQNEGALSIRLLFTFIWNLLHQITALKNVIKGLESKVEDLTKENKRLNEELQKPEKNSVNSSIPSSRERYPRKKPPKLDENGKPIKGKPGAKPGHKAHHRKKPKPKKGHEAEIPIDLPDVEVPTEEVEIKPESTNCPKCDKEMVRKPDRDHHKEQCEFVPNPITRKHYTFQAYKCPDCGEIHYGSVPSLGTGLLGPRILSLLLFLKAVGHVSFTGIQRFLGIFDLKVSRGFICQTLDKASQALNEAYNDLKEALPAQPMLNIDETGHKENGKRIWTWVFRSKTFAFFAIKVDRSSSVLVEFLGKAFKGIIGCDYASAYRKFIKDWGVKAQFCMAHLKRDIQFMVDHIANPELSGYGTKLMGTLTEIFDNLKLWQQLKESREPGDTIASPPMDENTETTAQETLEKLRKLSKRLKEEALEHPIAKPAQNMAERFQKWPDNFYSTFLDDEGIAAGLGCSNNAAEQIIRTVVLDRQVTQGTRSKNGRNRCERVWSVVATCAIQGRSAYGFIKNAIKAHFRGDEEYPKIIKNKIKIRAGYFCRS
jgi:transposase